MKVENAVEVKIVKINCKREIKYKSVPKLRYHSTLSKNGITTLYVKLQKTQHSLDLDKKLSKLVGIVIKIISMKIRELFSFACPLNSVEKRDIYAQ